MNTETTLLEHAAKLEMGRLHERILFLEELRGELETRLYRLKQEWNDRLEWKPRATGMRTPRERSQGMRGVPPREKSTDELLSELRTALDKIAAHKVTAPNGESK